MGIHASLSRPSQMHRMRQNEIEMKDLSRQQTRRYSQNVMDKEEVHYLALYTN